MKQKTPKTTTPADKVCARCGRSFSWRAKWKNDWDAVRFCSAACRQNKLGDVDARLEAAIRALLAQRAGHQTICPSEAARAVGDDEDGWRALMEPARQAARRLVAAGVIDIVQAGVVVDGDTARGPIRLRRRT